MEAKDILEYMGIEAKDMDEFKAKFPEKYASEKQAVEKWLSPEVGKVTGNIKRKILNKAREDGLEFTLSEFEKMDLEDVHATIAEKKAGKFKSELEELKAKSGQTNEEALKEWQDKFAKATKRASDEEELRKQLAGEFDQFKTKAAGEVKSVKVGFKKSDLLSKLKFKTGISDLEKEGFLSHIDKNYKFDFDDQDVFFAADASGNRIRSSKKADEHKSPEEIVNEVAAEKKILAENPKAGHPAPASFVPPVQGNPAQNGTPAAAKRKVNPMFDNY